MITKRLQHGKHRLPVLFAAALLVMTFVMTLMLAASARPAAAQEMLLGQVSLRDTQDSYDLGPSTFMLRDPDGKVPYAQVLEKYRARERGDGGRNAIMNIGSKPVAHWLVVPLSNESWTEDWMLSFGSAFTGRLGKIGKIFVYDEISKTRYIDTVNLTKNPYLAEGAMMGEALPLKLARGKKALLVMYIVPEAGVPVMIAPRLAMAHGYFDQINDPFNPYRLWIGGFMLMIGFFMGTVLFLRMWSSLGFIVYYALLITIFSFHENASVTKFSLDSEVFALLFSAVAILGLFCARFFLSIKRFYRYQNRAIIGFVLGILIAGAVGNIMVPDMQWSKPVLLFLPSVLGMMFTILLCAAQAQSGKYAAYELGAAWVFPAIGSIIVILTAMNILTPTPLLVGAFWISLLPQAVALIWATANLAIFTQRDREMEKKKMESEAESISLLKQSRDASENARLLRVIDHEREVMNELRERELKQSEEMRSARDAADEANRAKSAFLAVISHEIRTPMSGIVGMVRLLLDTKLSKDQTDYVQTMQDSGDAMLSLLNDILDFEKIESGKMELEHIDFDLSRLIQGVVTLMSGHAEAKGVVLKAELDPAAPRYVIGDPVRLRQVLLNLAGNSIKFTDRGSVTIHVKADKAGEQLKGMARLRFAVQDTGVGISREAQKRLFNPFSQADSSVSRRFGGTGLGLAISQRLIEAMGGKIAIDSTEGRGSTFFFTLMVEEGSAEGVHVSVRQSAFNQQKPDKALNILVVEDNEVGQKLMKEFIQRLGHEVTLSGTGEDGLQRIEQEKFDLVLMDIELPGISGMGATRTVRAMSDPERAAIPIIAMTGNVRDEDVHQCYAANMNGHIPKPVDPQRLKEAIQKVIDGRLDNPVKVETAEEKSWKMPEAELTFSPELLAEAQKMNIEREAHAQETPPPAPPPAPAPAPEEKVDSRDEISPLAQLVREAPELEASPLTPAIRKQPVAPAPESFGKDVFDTKMLGGLRKGMGDGPMQSLLDEMFEKSDQIIGDMKVAQEQDNGKLIAARAHELKGMASNFGFMEISRLAGTIEDAAKADGSVQGAGDALQQLTPAMERARAALGAWMGGS